MLMYAPKVVKWLSEILRMSISACGPNFNAYGTNSMDMKDLKF